MSNGNFKDAVDETGISAQQSVSQRAVPAKYKNTLNQGTFGENRLEAVPQYINTDSEVIYKNKNNAWIVLGRDRPAGRASGYGGAGDTGAASIDLVVGRMGANPDTDKHVDPNLKTDAARIYISQKTDIDDNFKLTDGTIGKVKAKSGIGIKADGVRVIAREGIKFVTTTDSVNSQGGDVKSIGNIEFIAGNEGDKLEPLVKGKQLKWALDQILKQLSDLTDNFNKFVLSQIAYNTAIAAHTHACVGPLVAMVALPAITLVSTGATTVTNQASDNVPGAVIGSINKAGLKFNILNDMGSHYILSKNVHTT